MGFGAEIYNPAIAATYDISARTRSITISKLLDSGVTSYAVNARNIYLEHIFHHLIVKKDASDLITGIIVDQSDRQTSGDKQVIFNCQDWGYYLTKRIVAENYTSKTASYILNALLAKYASEVTRLSIDTSTATITEAKFTYVTLKDAIEYVMSLSPDWHYYIDRNKDFHFFYRYETTGPEVTAAKIQIDTLQVDYEGIDHYNRVWIVGRKQPSTSAIDVYYTADGEQKYFGPLPYEPASLAVYFTPTGLPEYQLTLISEGNDTTGAEAVYNAKQRVFYLTDPAFFTGKLRANFKPMRQFIEYFENVSDIATYGLMEKAIKNKDVTDKLEARRFGKAEVKRSSVVQRTLNFTSRHTDLLGTELGELLDVDITNGAWSITGDFLVTRMNHTIMADGVESVMIEAEELL